MSTLSLSEIGLPGSCYVNHILCKRKQLTTLLLTHPLLQKLPETSQCLGRNVKFMLYLVVGQMSYK